MSTTADSSSPAGQYPITITQGTLSAVNYNFVFNNGTLTVTPVPAPIILSSGLTNGIFTATWSSTPGVLYGLQFLSNLGDTNWNDVLPPVMATDSTSSQTNVVGDDPQQFYRVKIQPAGP